MDISVIVPVYNRAGLISRALTSVFSQSQPAQEVIVVDDGSNDGTGERVRERFPQVRYFRQPNRGVSSARNRGIAEARCEWLAFLDSDDVWLPYKLESQQRALAARPEYRICHSNETWIRRGQFVNPMEKHAKSGGHIFLRCLPRCVISPSSAILHRSVIAAVGMFDESLPACEDYDLWLRVCAVYPVLYLEQPLIKKYGGHADQLSQRYPAMDRFRIRALEKIFHANALSNNERHATLEVLLEKIRIYLVGAQKRQRWQEVAAYEKKQAYYSQLVTNAARTMA